MQRITRDRLAVVFDRRLPPVATVEPGEMFLVETEDARGGWSSPTSVSIVQSPVGGRRGLTPRASLGITNGLAG